MVIPQRGQRLRSCGREANRRRCAIDQRDRRCVGALSAPRPPQEDEPFDIWALYPEHADLPIDLLEEEERTELLHHPVASVRAAAASSFFNRELSSEDRKKLLDLATRDPSSTVRARAWEALTGAIEDDEVIDAMLAAMRNPEPAHRRTWRPAGRSRSGGGPQRSSRRNFRPLSTSRRSSQSFGSYVAFLASEFPRYFLQSTSTIRIWKFAAALCGASATTV